MDDPFLPASMCTSCAMQYRGYAGGMEGKVVPPIDQEREILHAQFLIRRDNNFASGDGE